MAENKKISSFVTEEEIDKVAGIAGFKETDEGKVNVQISGTQLKEQVLKGFEPEVSWDNVSDKPETFAPITGTEANQAMPGNTTIPTNNDQITNGRNFITEAEVPDPEWSDIQNKPTTFAPIIGTTAADALAGNTTTISTAQATAISNSLQEQESGLDTRVAFFGGDGQVGGSNALTYTSDTLSIGNNSFAGTLQIYGNYLGLPANYQSPKITFYVDNSDDANESYTQILEASSSATGNQKIILPSAAATTTGQVLSSSAVDGTKVTTSWVTPTTSGGVDFSTLNGNTARVNLNTVTSQPKYGTSETFTALGSIEVGQVIVYDYTSGLVKATVASTLPPSNEVVGIALEDAADGNSVAILTEGFGTIKRLTITTANSDDYTLPSLNTGSVDTRNLTNNTRFRDDGGNSNYSNNVEYGVVFDVGDSSDITGTRYMIMNLTNFEFERQSFSFSQEDRLGIQVSNDGTNFQNFDTLKDPVTGINWMQRMENDSPPWSSNFGDGGAWYNSAATTDGYVFPVSDDRAADINTGDPDQGNTPVSVLNKDIPITNDGTTSGTPWRYVKFIFLSNSSDSFQNDGWDMKLTPSVVYADSPPINPPIGSLIYVDQNNPGEGILDNTGSVLIGKSAAAESDNDSLFIRLLNT